MSASNLPPSEAGAGLIILEKFRHAPISKNRAYCLRVFLPRRMVKPQGSIIYREVGAHWEQVTSHGRVVRCHTELEAQEARALLLGGIEQGQWNAVEYLPYDPSPNDLPYYEWVRGEKRRVTNRLGIRESDLPESQDEGLTRMSDDEWLLRGPR